MVVVIKMTNDLYSCKICGKIISLIEPKDNDTICCNQPMDLIEEKTNESEGKEKHVPIIEKEGELILVKVGSIEHPMEEDHYIKLIQLVKEGKVLLEKRLEPGDSPLVKFYSSENFEKVKARALCNKHGLWISK